MESDVDLLVRQAAQNGWSRAVLTFARAVGPLRTLGHISDNGAETILALIDAMNTLGAGQNAWSEERIAEAIGGCTNA